MCSRLVESGKIPSGKYAISKNFGQTYKEFDDGAFQKFAKENIYFSYIIHGSKDILGKITSK